MTLFPRGALIRWLAPRGHRPRFYPVAWLYETAGIGVATNPWGEQSMPEIQQQADQAMCLAKARGRNRVSCLGAAAEPALMG